MVRPTPLGPPPTRWGWRGPLITALVMGIIVGWQAFERAPKPIWPEARADMLIQTASATFVAYLICLGVAAWRNRVVCGPRLKR